MRTAVLGLGALTALVFVGGCLLVTGGTSGYSLLDSGSGSCMSAAECDAGSVCCLDLSSQSTSLSGTCLTSCVAALPQLCTTTAECADAGACVKQSCSGDSGTGLSVTLQLCGLQKSCTASP